MGLDITAYRGLRKAEGDEGKHAKWPEEPDYENGWHRIFVSGDDFPGRADEFEDGAIYHAEEDYRFRAGSYGGYNVWRKQLAQLAGYRDDNAVWDDPKPGPFVELINFSDCEGTLGTAICAKLAGDFAAFQEKADAHPDEYFRQKYADWRIAFEMASDRGAVVFG